MNLRILISLSILIFIPNVRGQYYDCSGKGFLCRGPTHFYVCVDMGGGRTQTMDEVAQLCPINTFCDDRNPFECMESIHTPKTPESSVLTLAWPTSYLENLGIGTPASPVPSAPSNAPPSPVAPEIPPVYLNSAPGNIFALDDYTDNYLKYLPIIKRDTAGVLEDGTPLNAEENNSNPNTVLPISTPTDLTPSDTTGTTEVVPLNSITPDLTTSPESNISSPVPQDSTVTSEMGPDSSPTPGLTTVPVIDTLNSTSDPSPTSESDPLNGTTPENSPDPFSSPTPASAVTNEMDTINSTGPDLTTMPVTDPNNSSTLDPSQTVPDSTPIIPPDSTPTISDSTPIQESSPIMLYSTPTPDSANPVTMPDSTVAILDLTATMPDSSPIIPDSTPSMSESTPAIPNSTPSSEIDTQNGTIPDTNLTNSTPPESTAPAEVDSLNSTVPGLATVPETDSQNSSTPDSAVTMPVSTPTPELDPLNGTNPLPAPTVEQDPLNGTTPDPIQPFEPINATIAPPTANESDSLNATTPSSSTGEIDPLNGTTPQTSPPDEIDPSNVTAPISEIDPLNATTPQVLPISEVDPLNVTTPQASPTGEIDPLNMTTPQPPNDIDPSNVTAPQATPSSEINPLNATVTQEPINETTLQATPSSELDPLNGTTELSPINITSPESPISQSDPINSTAEPSVNESMVPYMITPNSMLTPESSTPIPASEVENITGPILIPIPVSEVPITTPEPSLIENNTSSPPQTIYQPTTIAPILDDLSVFPLPNASDGSQILPTLLNRENETTTVNSLVPETLPENSTKNIISEIPEFSNFSNNDLSDMSSTPDHALHTRTIEPNEVQPNTSQVSSSPVNTSVTQPSSLPTLTTPIAVPSDTACDAPGHYPDESSCHSYYLCIDNIKYKLICPYNYVYSPSLQKCTTAKEQCTNTNEYICSSIGRFPDTMSCYSYFECFPNGPGFTVMRLHCPWYSSFQPTSGMCGFNNGCGCVQSPQVCNNFQPAPAKSPELDRPSLTIYYPDNMNIKPEEILVPTNIDVVVPETQPLNPNCPKPGESLPPGELTLLYSIENSQPGEIAGTGSVGSQPDTHVQQIVPIDVNYPNSLYAGDIAVPVGHVAPMMPIAESLPNELSSIYNREPILASEAISIGGVPSPVVASNPNVVNPVQYYQNGVAIDNTYTYLGYGNPQVDHVPYNPNVPVDSNHSPGGTWSQPDVNNPYGQWSPNEFAPWTN